VPGARAAGWGELLSRLAEVPRENGTPGIHAAATWLVETFEAAGLEPELFAFQATPFVLRLAGVLALAGGLLYWRLVRARRFGAALAVALLVPGALLLQLELYRPVFGWLGAQTQHHVLVKLPAQRAEQRLAFAAHYDTKTDLLDHVERAPVDFLAAPMIPLMLLGALAGLAAPRARRGARALQRSASLAGVAGAVYGVLTGVALSAGALVQGRSPGALDDGASCAVLVRLAEELAAAAPLARTEVEVWLLSAEEVGVQGSFVYARERFSRPPDLPTFVVNLEGLGASAAHGVFPSERTNLRAFAPDPRLVAHLDAVHREVFSEPLAVFPVGGATDARSFLAHGVPAATLYSRIPGQPLPRDLHSAGDDRSRLDESALDASLAYLLAVARAADARGL
jgi:acetylornithine deacetylase/succinyl-diaminopimelate desuccinylase-like protein